MAETIDVDVAPSEAPGGRLVLVTHGKRVIEPVVDILAPDQGAMDLDFAVLEASGLHDSVDMIGLILEDDLAILAALLECFNDSWGRVASVWHGRHYADIVLMTMVLGFPASPAVTPRSSRATVLALVMMIGRRAVSRDGSNQGCQCCG